ncbi:MAG: DUF3310 domain-containing protein [Desulfobulbaceae bacterium]|nr:DUF3310 domain-containing protein [Desulfobulbaceae bacterium]
MSEDKCDTCRWGWGWKDIAGHWCPTRGAYKICLAKDEQGEYGYKLWADKNEIRSCLNCGNIVSGEGCGEECKGSGITDCFGYINWVPKDKVQSQEPEILPDDGNPFNSQIGGNHYKTPGVVDIAEFLMRHKVEPGEANVMKYVFRHEKKNGIEDLRKAQHYLQFIAWVKYNTVL